MSHFNHSQLDGLSADCPSAFTAALAIYSYYDWELNVVNNDCERNNHVVIDLFCLWAYQYYTTASITRTCLPLASLILI